MTTKDLCMVALVPSKPEVRLTRMAYLLSVRVRVRVRVRVGVRVRVRARGRARRYSSLLHL